MGEKGSGGHLPIKGEGKANSPPCGKKKEARLLVRDAPRGVGLTKGGKKRKALGSKGPDTQDQKGNRRRIGSHVKRGGGRRFPRKGGGPLIKGRKGFENERGAFCGGRKQDFQKKGQSGLRGGSLREDPAWEGGLFLEGDHGDGKENLCGGSMYRQAHGGGLGRGRTTFRKRGGTWGAPLGRAACERKWLPSGEEKRIGGLSQGWMEFLSGGGRLRNTRIWNLTLRGKGLITNNLERGSSHGIKKPGMGMSLHFFSMVN